MTIPMERVENRILTIRGYRVMLDADLAEQGPDTLGGRAAARIADILRRPMIPQRENKAVILRSIRQWRMIEYAVR